ncbi:MAG: hypothetical protein R3F11_17240 [Verrucomicrobiales bacterium]
MPPTTASSRKRTPAGGSGGASCGSACSARQGSNFRAIADAIAAGSLDAEIALVISDQPDAPILDKARALGIPAGPRRSGSLRQPLGSRPPP